MSLRTRLERAFEKVIRDIPGFPSDTTGVYRGADFDIHQAPCVTCWCKGGIEDPTASGNRAMDVTIIVKVHGLEDEIGDGSDLDPIAQLEALTNLVFPHLVAGDPNVEDPNGLAAKLTKAGLLDGLTVYHPVIETGYDPDLAEFSFLESLTFRVFCCGTNL